MDLVITSSLCPPATLSFIIGIQYCNIALIGMRTPGSPTPESELLPPHHVAGYILVYRCIQAVSPRWR